MLLPRWPMLTGSVFFDLVEGLPKIFPVLAC